MSSITFSKYAIAPPNMKHINVYNSKNEKIFQMPLGDLNSKNTILGKKLYSFAAVSDIHIGNVDGLERFKYFC